MRKRNDNEPLEDFLDDVASDTAASLTQGGTPDSDFRATVFLHLNRTLEAGATLTQSARSLGVALGRAGLDEASEDKVYDELESLGPLLEAQYDQQLRKQGAGTWWQRWR